MSDDKVHEQGVVEDLEERVSNLEDKDAGPHEHETDDPEDGEMADGDDGVIDPA